jgi:hypothetical protein
MEITQEQNLSEIVNNKEIFSHFKFAHILLISPNFRDYCFWKELLPRAKFTVSNHKTWDLNTEFKNSLLSKFLRCNRYSNPENIFDLAIAQNVFMYLPVPNVSANNIGKVCTHLFIQDLTYRKRSEKSEFGDDLDVSRYGIELGMKDNPQTHLLVDVFSMGVVLFEKMYEGRANRYHGPDDPPIHLLAMIKFKNSKAIGSYSRVYSICSVIFLTFGAAKNRLISLLFATFNLQSSGLRFPK